MKLYHGTDKDFFLPDLKFAREKTDFGKGFYLTEKEKLAQDWVKGKSVEIVNIYELSLENIPTCNLRIKHYDADEQWAKYIYSNRKGKLKSNQYDIVIGPIADNGLVKLFDKIDRKELSFSEIVSKLRMKKFDAQQYCFKTEKAIKMLEYASRK